MKILAVECSAAPCSAAVYEDGKVLASEFTNIKTTHSQVLMPMVKSVLQSSSTDIKNIDGFAVSAGPGSFTGVRIGISTVKGMAAVRNTPCAAVSTLRAMAENYADSDCIVCAVMDARCNQVYNANFKIKSGTIERLCEDRALLCEDLAKEIKEIAENGNRVIIVGDGAEVFYPFVLDTENVHISDECRRYQNAVGVCAVACKMFKEKDFISPENLRPVYLRLPQAERELKNKRGN